MIKKTVPSCLITFDGGCVFLDIDIFVTVVLVTESEKLIETESPCWICIDRPGRCWNCVHQYEEHNCHSCNGTGKKLHLEKTPQRVFHIVPNRGGIPTFVEGSLSTISQEDAKLSPIVR